MSYDPLIKGTRPMETRDALYKSEAVYCKWDKRSRDVYFLDEDLIKENAVLRIPAYKETDFDTCTPSGELELKRGRILIPEKDEINVNGNVFQRFKVYAPVEDPARHKFFVECTAGEYKCVKVDAPVHGYCSGWYNTVMGSRWQHKCQKICDQSSPKCKWIKINHVVRPIEKKYYARTKSRGILLKRRRSAGFHPELLQLVRKEHTWTLEESVRVTHSKVHLDEPTDTKSALKRRMCSGTWEVISG